MAGFRAAFGMEFISVRTNMKTRNVCGFGHELINLHVHELDELPIENQEL